ncbi:MAG: hypothetical protein AB7N80_13365 [Bdellovibrionales bacterium]
MASLLLTSLHALAADAHADCDRLLGDWSGLTQAVDVKMADTFTDQQMAKLGARATPGTKRVLEIFLPHLEDARSKALNGIRGYANFLAYAVAVSVFSSAIDDQGFLKAGDATRFLLSFLSEEQEDAYNALPGPSLEATDFWSRNFLIFMQDHSADEVDFIFRSIGGHNRNAQNRIAYFLPYRQDIEAEFDALIQRFRQGFWARPTLALSEIEDLNLMVLRNEWPVVLLDGQTVVSLDGYEHVEAQEASKHDLLGHFMSPRPLLVTPSMRGTAMRTLARFSNPRDQKIVHLIYYSSLHENRRLDPRDLMALIKHQKHLRPEQIDRLESKILQDLQDPFRLKGYLAVGEFKAHFRRVLKIMGQRTI